MSLTFYDWVEAAAGQNRFELLPLDPLQTSKFLARFNDEIDQLINRLGEDSIASAIWEFYGCGGDVREATDPSLGASRISFMHSVKSLYSKGFAVYCSQYLGHLDQGKGSARPLNTPCYMLWDMDGIECRAFQHDQEMVKLSFEVLMHALSIPHLACQESALHGLGHLAAVHQDQVHSVVQHALRANHILSELSDYAKRVVNGAVQ
jgi:hypothetical protein